MAEKTLAEKLDDDLVEFLSTLKPRASQDPWPEDRWEEEMEKHPLFMTKPIEEGAELPPMVEALQQLKFDPDLNTPEELAQSFKDEGNQYFKLKKYKWAVIAYTEALKANCTDEETNAILYTNRAAAHFHLGNIQKSLKDSIEAINKMPGRVKAIQRAVQCLLKLKNFDECISLCEKGLNLQSDDKFKKLFQNSIKEAIAGKKTAERDERKASFVASNKAKKWKAVKTVIEQRHINCDLGINDRVPDWWSDEKTVADSKVHLDEHGALIWPVLILYPEYNVTDFIQHFHENICFDDQLKEIFSPGNEPSWDKERKYKFEDLQIYYGYEKTAVPVDRNEKLQNILSDKKVSVVGGVPSFFITVKNSKFDCYWKSKGLKDNF